MKANSGKFQLICEIMDDFISSNRVRCIECSCIITDKEYGAICDKCYGNLTPGELQDLEQDD